MARERNRLQTCSYNNNARIAPSTSRQERESWTQQLPDISRPMRRRRLSCRRVWCRTWLVLWTLFGQYDDNLLHELNREDTTETFSELMLNADLFAEILDRNSPNKTKYKKNCYELFTSHLRKN